MTMTLTLTPVSSGDVIAAYRFAHSSLRFRMLDDVAKLVALESSARGRPNHVVVIDSRQAADSLDETLAWTTATVDRSLLLVSLRAATKAYYYGARFPRADRYSALTAAVEAIEGDRVRFSVVVR